MKLTRKQYKLLKPFRKYQKQRVLIIKSIVNQLGIKYSNSNTSYYFDYNGLKYRLSTHPAMSKVKHSTYDVDIIIYRDYDVQSIIRFIQLIHRNQ